MDRRKLLEGLGLNEDQIAPLLTADIGRIIVDGEPAIQVDENCTATLLVAFPYGSGSTPGVMLIDAGGRLDMDNCASLSSYVDICGDDPEYIIPFTRRDWVTIMNQGGRSDETE